MKGIKKLLAFVVIIAVVTAVVPSEIKAATTTKLSKKKVTLTITNSKKNPTTTLKVKGLSQKKTKKAKWTTSNKSVAVVKKGKVTAKKAGKATITCKVKSKKYKRKVTVVDKRTKKKVDSKSLNITTKRASTTGIGGVKQIIVTYNGKDVTNKAKYTTKHKVRDPKPRYVEEPGIITNAPNTAVFWLTASYKGEMKTVKIEKQSIWWTYTECRCGETFYDDEGFWCQGMNGCDCSNDVADPRCALGKRDRHWLQWSLAELEKCDIFGHRDHFNYYIVPYVRYVDFVIEGVTEPMENGRLYGPWVYDKNYYEYTN